MKRSFLFFLLLIALNSLSQFPAGIEGELTEFRLAGYAQGTTYHISYFAVDSVVTVTDVDLVLAGIDSSLSIYKPYSIISRFNTSRSGLDIDDHFRKVFQKSVEVTKRTGGLFDITVKPLVQAWGFGVDKTQNLPDAATIKSILQCVGADKIRLDHTMLIKTEPCVTIDVNGIAQGYSVDVLADFLKSRNIQNFLVELGGEMRIEGRKPSGDLFKVGIEAPGDQGPVNQPLQKTFSLAGGALTTSGNYRQYYTIGTKRISHLINPQTGFPVNNELISVTVYAKDAMTADAYDNALMLMGLNKALAFVESNDELAAYFIYKMEDGSVADTACSKFKRLLNQ
jgi:thiamine biosynthesis lipoprotein